MTETEAMTDRMESVVEAPPSVDKTAYELGWNHGWDAAYRASPAGGERKEADGLADLVSRFSEALLTKLYVSKNKGRDGWDEDGWQTACQIGLLRHVAKGDPLDVAAYAAFLWHHGWRSMASGDIRTATPNQTTVLALQEADGPNTWNGGAPEGYYPQKYVDELRGKIEAMRKALEPFASSPYAAVGSDFDDYDLCQGIKISDLKRAVSALAALEGTQS